jgi:hypothetical protein
MARPPQHRADAPIVFIWSKDPAWDFERVNAELKADPEHVVKLYIDGKTRGDITAPDAEGRVVTDYLDGTETRVEMSRLKILDVARFRDASGRMGQLAAAKTAYAGDINGLVEAHGADFVFEMGEFALQCSEAPRPGEPKRSDS